MHKTYTKRYHVIVMFCLFYETAVADDAGRILCCTVCCAACCNLKLMDTTQQVVVDTGWAVPPGRYRAVRLRVCSTEQMLVQVWTPTDNQTFQLKWQTSLTPTNADTLQDWVTVRDYCRH